MKEIKAYIHGNRIADVISAVEQFGQIADGAAPGVRNINVTTVHGLLKPVNNTELHYSVELGEAVIDEMRLELLCEDHLVQDLVALIERTARTGQALAGWILVTDVFMVTPIGGPHA